MVHHSTFQVETKKTSEVIDITEQVGAAVSSSGIKNGLVLVFTPHSTASVATIEFESHLLKDFSKLMEELSPARRSYEHQKAWGEKNGFSHLRATLLGSSVTFPVADGLLVAGPWQQVVLVEHDVAGRSRSVHCTVIGE